MRAQRIGRLPELSAQKLAGTMKDLYCLLFSGLDGHEAHRRALHGFTDRCGVGLIILLPPHIRHKALRTPEV